MNVQTEELVKSYKEIVAKLEASVVDFETKSKAALASHVGLKKAANEQRGHIKRFVAQIKAIENPPAVKAAPAPKVSEKLPAAPKPPAQVKLAEKGKVTNAQG